MSDPNKYTDSMTAPKLQGPAASADVEALKIYAHNKLKLANELKFIRDGLNALGRVEAEQQIAGLMEKLADDRFVLAVLGQFKRGKSSLMNAIIGRELLPTGVLPLTSAITVLRYGSDERLVVSYNESPFPEELPVSALPDFVTEAGNPGNRKKVKTALVELPVPFLRRGVEFVDTPGIGSAIEANTATTYSFLPECDAVLFVTSVDTPMTAAELDFLKEIGGYVHKLFFIVNKTDTIKPSERDPIISFVKETIEQQAGFRPERIFPVSARMGLNAQLEGDPARYRESGIKELEETLADFLSGEKQSTFLSAIAHKASTILVNEKALGTFTEAALKSFGTAAPGRNAASVQRDPFEAAGTILQAWQRIDQLNNFRNEWTEDKAIHAENPPEKLKEQDEQVLPLDIKADLAFPECPVCQYIQKSVYQFFTEYQYQLGISENTQTQFAGDLGFCALHTWQLLAICSPQGASTGFAPLANHISRMLYQGEFRTLSERLTRKEESCHICHLSRQAEVHYIGQLFLFLSAPEGMARYLKSQGVCLKHLHQLIDLTNDETIKARLITHAAARFEEDAEDMQTFVLKRDTLRRSMQSRSEKNAYQRMIARMAGSRGVNTPWPGDGEI